MPWTRRRSAGPDAPISAQILESITGPSPKAADEKSGPGQPTRIFVSTQTIVRAALPDSPSIPAMLRWISETELSLLLYGPIPRGEEFWIYIPKMKNPEERIAFLCVVDDCNKGGFENTSCIATATFLEGEPPALPASNEPRNSSEFRIRENSSIFLPTDGSTPLPMEQPEPALPPMQPPPVAAEPLPKIVETPLPPIDELPMPKIVETPLPPIDQAPPPKAIETPPSVVQTPSKIVETAIKPNLESRNTPIIAAIPQKTIEIPPPMVQAPPQKAIETAPQAVQTPPKIVQMELAPIAESGNASIIPEAPASEGPSESILDILMRISADQPEPAVEMPSLVFEDESESNIEAPPPVSENESESIVQTPSPVAEDRPEPTVETPSQVIDDQPEPVVQDPPVSDDQGESIVETPSPVSEDEPEPIAETLSLVFEDQAEAIAEASPVSEDEPESIAASLHLVFEDQPESTVEAETVSEDQPDSIDEKPPLVFEECDQPEAAAETVAAKVQTPRLVFADQTEPIVETSPVVFEDQLESIVWSPVMLVFESQPPTVIPPQRPKRGLPNSLAASMAA